ncbi:hypothetical protein [Streptomyces longisporoflavus]|uniref:Uncharacterized protein n=1 Tax=Streptomyces longisporoflavus TaxID=28044 RepID=A0ABW7QEY4_9ACTN
MRANIDMMTPPSNSDHDYKVDMVPDGVIEVLVDRKLRSSSSRASRTRW